MAGMGTEPNTATTRDRVLSAALAQFLTQPYDKATLRSIAHDARVDVAYVHRLFGSKQALFTEVLSVIFEQETPVWPPTGDLVESITLLNRTDSGALGTQGTDPIDLLILSLVNLEARAAIVDFLGQHVLGPLEASLEGPDATVRAERVFAFLIGVRITRRFIGLKSLEGYPPEEWKEWLSKAIRCICGD